MRPGSDDSADGAAIANGRAPEALMERIRMLKQVALFREVADPVLAVVAGAAEEVTVSAGETIVAPAEEPHALYVIRNGTVSIQFPDGEAPPLLFGAGETIGEVLFVDGGAAGATAVALERVDLLVLRSERLAGALAREPGAGHELYRAIAKSLAARMRRAVAMLAFAREHRA
jgi:CRP-like cAMP-binding protein